MKLWRLLAILVFVTFASVPVSASAQLLFSGGEDSDFICNTFSGSCGTVTSGGTFRPNWARAAYYVAGSTSDPPTNRFATPVFTASSTLWLHAQFCDYYSGCSGNGTTANGQLLRVFDSAGYPTLIVRGTGTAGQLKISSRTSAGAFTDLVTCSSAFNLTLTQLDFFVNYGPSGQVAIYSSGVQVCNYVGDVTNGDGATALNQVEFSAAAADAYGLGAAWSEIIISTSDTRAMSRFTANTSGNGATTGFTGTNICSTIWNAISYNDVNYGYSGSSGVVHECTVNSAVPPGNYSVVALVMSARAQVGATGPLHFDFVTRLAGTDYTSTDFAPTTVFSNISNYIQTVNPATSSPWAVSDFTATGFNVGEETKP